MPTAAPTPRGGLIAFTSERNGNAEIYVMNADGSDPQRLTHDPAYDGWPSWSPDGSQIAFSSSRNGKPDIYVMDADGSNPRQLTHHLPAISGLSGLRMVRGSLFLPTVMVTMRSM